jgi:putative drug exporter of the RND superfamily
MSTDTTFSTTSPMVTSKVSPPSLPNTTTTDDDDVFAPPNTWMIKKDESEGKSEDIYHSFVRNYYMPFLIKYKNIVLIVWLIVFIICLITGTKFLQSTRSNLDLPKGTYSEDAILKFQALYPGAGSWAPAIVFQQTSGERITNNATKAFATAMTKFADDNKKVISSVSGYWELASIPGGLFMELALSTIAPNNRSMLTTVGFKSDTTLNDINHVIDDLIHFAEKYTTSDTFISVTGIFPLFRQMSEDTEKSFVLIDAVVLPIAILILGARLRSYRHMGIAFVNLGCALLLAFAIMTPISAPGAIDVNPFAPSIMLSLGIAICFDYSLFMLCRFKEERLVFFRSKEDAVFETVVSAGHVVLLSGATLFFTFVILLFFPQNFLQSVGFSCASVVFTAIFANMTVTPAILLSCDCFSHFELLPSSTNVCCRIPRKDAATAAKEEEAIHALSETAKIEKKKSEDNALAVVSGGAGSFAAIAKGRGDILFTMSYAFTLPFYKYVILAITFLIAIPFIIEIVKLNPSSDDGLLFLSGSSTLDTLNLMKKDFSPGSLNPYQILIDTGKPMGVFTKEYFQVENDVIKTLIKNIPDYVNAASFSGLSFYRGNDVSFETSMQYFNQSSPLFFTGPASAYRSVVGVTQNTAKSANLLRVETLVQPTSEVVVPFLLHTRNYLSTYVPSTTVTSTGFNPKLYLFGAFSTTYDVQQALYKLVPLDVGLVVAIVVIIIGLSFGSLFLIFRLIVTLCLSLIFVFGLMVLVYQRGPAQDAFKVLTPTLANSVGVYWIIPIMSFSILVGLALDYDVFLLGRIVEYRMMGWSDRAAACLAVQKTGSVITAAGLIMAVSFLGLMIPKTVVLNQYGFSLTMGVLFDTFLVRPIIVPAIVAIVEDFKGVDNPNWWPRKMPPVLLSAEDEAKALAANLWDPKEFSSLKERIALRLKNDGEEASVLIVKGGEEEGKGKGTK